MECFQIRFSLYCSSFSYFNIWLITYLPSGCVCNKICYGKLKTEVEENRDFQTKLKNVVARSVISSMASLFSSGKTFVLVSFVFTVIGSFWKKSVQSRCQKQTHLVVGRCPYERGYTRLSTELYGRNFLVPHLWLFGFAPKAIDSLCPLFATQKNSRNKCMSSHIDLSIVIVLDFIHKSWTIKAIKDHKKLTSEKRGLPGSLTILIDSCWKLYIYMYI